MPLTPELRARIEHTLQSNRVVLFMKGDPQGPRCGFSAKAAGILNDLVPGNFRYDRALALPESVSQTGRQQPDAGGGAAPSVLRGVCAPARARVLRCAPFAFPQFA